MRALFVLAMTLTAITAAACTNDDVPTITDPKNITVNDKQMTAAAFHDAYCKVKPSNEICIAVKRQAEKEAALYATRRTR
ncbi:hypothetical protein BAC3_01181 [uncultured bacterium]|nr:hypothetical protein BAC3_01181 [uncultured bacterium]